MAVAGLTPDGHHRDMEYPSVQRTPMSSPHRIRSSYTQPGRINALVTEAHINNII